MRTLMIAALAVLTLGLVDARPASAAWSCIGAEYVCGTSPKASAASSSWGEEKRAARKQHRAKASASAGWLGDDEAAPARKSRKKRSVETASNWYGDSDESASRRSKRSQRVARSYDSDSGSSSQSGMASYYWQPQRVASGGWFNPNAMTAAHKTLPFGTKVRVTNKRNGSSVVVTINDRGPYVAGRVIDLSSAAAGAISMKGAGVVPVSIAVLGR